MTQLNKTLKKPSKKQRLYYSGKKKRHTIKTEVRITPDKRIVHISKPSPGSVHDFALHKREPKIPKNSKVYVDSGYQGIHLLYPLAEYPYKSSKHHPLDKIKRKKNQELSRFRTRIEHVFARLKKFRILADTFRNKISRYHQIFNIISGIVNMKNGFS